MKTIYQIAQAEVGVQETPGFLNTVRITEYHASTSIGKSDDSVPWCSSFVNWCVTQAGYAGTNSPAARSWLKWGKEVKKPFEGCIVVLSRGNKSWQGHVGFYVGETEHKIRVLGGNQNDQVKISDYPKEKVLGFRTVKGATDSKTVKASTIGTVIAAIGGAIQTFPEEIVDKAGLISGVLANFGEKAVTAVAVILVIVAFIYVVRERMKKIDERQI